MKILTRRDSFYALVTGLTTGVIAWRVLIFLDKVLPGQLAPWILVFLAPALWILGVQFGYALGAWFRPMTQFGRFVAIGFANAAVDFGVLYLLIGWTGKADGLAYALFKAISFAVAAVHSYLWNKYWAFDAAHSAGGTSEAVRFIMVALPAIVVNVAVASLVVHLAPATSDPKVWAGIGDIIGSAAALIFSFLGFRAFVFKKK